MIKNKSEIKILLMKIDGIENKEADMLISERVADIKDTNRKEKIKYILGQLVMEEEK